MMMIEGRGSIQERGSGDAGQALPQDGPIAGGYCQGRDGHHGQGENPLGRGSHLCTPPPFFART